MTDVSWNYEVKKRIKPFKPRPPDAPDGTWRMAQADVDRVQEFRKCIECFLCQDVCHVLRDHHLHDEFIGPRFLVYVAALEMHPWTWRTALEELRGAHGIGYCNITKCCTKVCPEHITITDNAIIPLKERVVDRFYDPLFKLSAYSGTGREPRERGAPSAGPSERGSGSAPADIAIGRAIPGEVIMAMFELKPLSREAVGRALEKAERYRLLNEPGEAESICLDILHVEPENQQALITLLLARTDEFDQPTGDVARAQEVVPRLKGAYEQAYYAGIVLERKARAQLRAPSPGMGLMARDGLRRAPWRSSRRRKGSAPPATTTRSCAGTRAPA